MGRTTCEFSLGTSDHSRILFARPSFIEGIARIFDFSGTISEYNRCENGEEADYRALWSDWHAIGMDIREAQRGVAEFISQQ